MRLAATEESDPERAGHMLLMQRNSQILSSARPWKMRRRIAAQARLEEPGGVWHESCAHPDAFRYPKAAMEAASSSPANIALPLAMGSIETGPDVIADLSGVVPFGDPRVRRVPQPCPLPTARAGTAFVVCNCCGAARAGTRRPLPRADQDRPLPCLRTDDDAPCTRHDQESITQAAMTGGGL